MKEAWEVAQLLEEFAKKADPRSVWRKPFTDNLSRLGNKSAMYSLEFDHRERLARAVYMLPVERVMQGVTGTPEEVIEWLKTGIDATDNRDAIQVSIQDQGGRRMFVVRQNLTGQMYTDLEKIMDDEWDRIQKQVDEMRIKFGI